MRLYIDWSLDNAHVLSFPSFTGAYKHLEQPSYAEILFADFFAFNKTQPHISSYPLPLADRLLVLLLDILTNKTKQVAGQWLDAVSSTSHEMIPWKELWLKWALTLRSQRGNTYNAKSHQCWGAWAICRSWLLSPASDGLQESQTTALKQRLRCKQTNETRSESKQQEIAQGYSCRWLLRNDTKADVIRNLF